MTWYALGKKSQNESYSNLLIHEINLSLTSNGNQLFNFQLNQKLLGSCWAGLLRLPPLKSQQKWKEILKKSTKHQKNKILTTANDVNIQAVVYILVTIGMAKYS